MCPLTPFKKSLLKFMCTCPNFVYLTKIDESPSPKCKKVKCVSTDLAGTKIEKYKILDDGFYSRFHYSFLPHASYDRVMREDPTAIDRLIPVNCGKCLECRIQYARSWADRCALEAKQYKYNYFVTLTYDDAHVPEYGSLYPRHVTLFIKRLRKQFSDVKIKYLYSGEYGSLSLRPHYHLILFNLPLNDLTYEFVSYETGQAAKHSFSHSKDLMYSPLIHKLWHDEKGSILGNISVANFSYDTAAYVSQYVTKKCGREEELKELYEKNHLVPEFLRMSKGISESSYSDVYFDEHDNIVIPGDGHVSSLPRYFTKLYYKTNDILSPKKLHRQSIKHAIRIQEYLNTKNFDRQAEIRDYNLKAKQNLKRVL